MRDHADTATDAPPGRLATALACPWCAAALTETDDGARCPGCGREFGRAGGVLDLRTSDAGVVAAMDDARGAQGRGWGAVAPARLDAVLRSHPSSVIDVGCAGGGYIHALGERGIDAYGVDLLPYDWPDRSSFALADAGALPFADDAADVVTAFEVLEHVPAVEATLRELARVARRRVVFSVPNAETPEWLRRANLAHHHWVDRTHVNFWTADTLARLIEETLSPASVEVERIHPANPMAAALGAMGIGGRVGRVLAGAWLRMLPAHRRTPTTLLASVEL